MSLRVDVWDQPGLLRRGPIASSLAVGSQRWTAAVIRVMRIGSARRPGSVFIVSMRLYGSLGRCRRARVVIDEAQLGCPHLPGSITEAFDRWLPSSCDGVDLVFRAEPGPRTPPLTPA